MLFEVYYSADDLAARRQRGVRADPADHRRRAARDAGDRHADHLGAHPAADPQRPRARAAAARLDDRVGGRAPTDRPRPPRRRRAGPRRDGVLADGRRPRQRVPDELRDDLHSAGQVAAHQPEVAAVVARVDPPARPARRRSGRRPHRPDGARRRGADRGDRAGRRHRPAARRHGRAGLAGGPGGRAQRHPARPSARRWRSRCTAREGGWCSAWPTTARLRPRGATATRELRAARARQPGGGRGRSARRTVDTRRGAPRCGWRWRSGEPRCQRGRRTSDDRSRSSWSTTTRWCAVA